MSKSKSRLSGDKEPNNPKIKANYKKVALLVGKETIFVEAPVEEIYLESYYQLSYDQQYEIFTEFRKKEDRYVNSQKAIVKDVNEEKEAKAKASSYILEKAQFSAQIDEIFTELREADDRIAKDRQETVRLATETRTILTDLKKQLG